MKATQIGLLSLMLCLASLLGTSASGSRHLLAPAGVLNFHSLTSLSCHSKKTSTILYAHRISSPLAYIATRTPWSVRVKLQR